MSRRNAKTSKRRRSRLEAIAGFFGPRIRSTAAEALERLSSRERFAAARMLVSAFYAALLFFAASSLFTWQDLLAVTEIAPRWPVFWLLWVEPATGIALILALYLLACLLGVALPRFRAVRILVFIALLKFLAFRFSFGSINHGEHLGVLLAFVLIFLPKGWHERGPGSPGRSVRAATLQVIFGCQAMILLTYSMSGLWKVGGVVEQILQGETSYLSPHGLAQQVANKLLSADRETLLGTWLIENYWVGWLLMLGALYLEFFALWAVARPSLHRLWGLGLILLHVSTHLTMGVLFPQNVLWLSLFLVASPFLPRQVSWRRAAGDLPVVGRWLGGGV